MRLYQIEHINAPHNPNKVMGMKLVFKAALCPTSGELREALRQPDEWDHVKRLTNQLFLAWDDRNALEGTVYFGDFEESPETADELVRLKEALEDANGMCRSAMAIAERKGDTNWESFTARLRKSLELQHSVMYPKKTL